MKGTSAAAVAALTRGAADINAPAVSGIQNDVVSMMVAGQLRHPVMAVQDVLEGRSASPACRWRQQRWPAR